MPIFLILFVTALCLRDVAWPPPAAGLSPGWAAAGVAGLALLPVLAAAVVSRATVRALRGHPEERSAAALRFGRLRRLVLAMNLACYAGSLVGLGWGWLVWDAARWDGTLLPFAELLVPLPFLAVLMGNWLVYYPAERALHVAGGVSRPYPSWPADWFAKLRRFVLFVLLFPILLAAQQTLERYLPRAWQESVWFPLTLFLLTLVVFVVMPVGVTYLLGMRSMPPGPRRDRFEALARRLNVRFRDILVWPSHGSIATAVMLGVVPRFRYCAFSDLLLEVMSDEELDAVFGHEIGHVKHWHLPYYLLFIALSSAVLTASLAVVQAATHDYRRAVAGGVLENAFVVGPLFAFGVYLFVVFGWLSRRCERQADLYGARAVSCGRTDCAVHGPEDFPARGAAPMCPTGVRVFVNALQRVANVNGLTPVGGEHPSFLHAAWAWVRAWQHGPIPARVAFLRTLLVDPAAERAAQRRIALVRYGLVAALVAAALLIGSGIGWTELWKGL